MLPHIPAEPANGGIASGLRSPGSGSGSGHRCPAVAVRGEAGRRRPSGCQPWGFPSPRCAARHQTSQSPTPREQGREIYPRMVSITLIQKCLVRPTCRKTPRGGIITDRTSLTRSISISKGRKRRRHVLLARRPPGRWIDRRQAAPQVERAPLTTAATRICRAKWREAPCSRRRAVDPGSGCDLVATARPVETEGARSATAGMPCPDATPMSRRTMCPTIHR